MLENRSFDQMLGFSHIQGIDAANGRPTRVEGLAGTETNPSPSRKRGRVEVSHPAEFVVSSDPGHEFTDVQEQLCGKGGAYASPTPSPGNVDPNIKNDGFVSSFAGKYPSADWETVMRCFTPEKQLPVLTTLAREFAVCDRWFSSMPGPTWPNRFFVHAASAGGLDHSPSLPREIASGAGDAYSFANGTVYDLLDSDKLDWAIYAGDEFPQALHMQGMDENLAKGRFRPFSTFKNEVTESGFSKSYIFIEPDWHPFTHFKGGNSQHPVDDVTHGEALIKEVYEAVRNSPIWEESLLILTYDEHGGFFDHVPPPATVDPGDKATSDDNNKNGFNFKQLGVRVPTVVVSPYISWGVIDHRLYDHSSIPATIEGAFGLTTLTERDKQATRLNTLLTLKDARTDAPKTLPDPATSGITLGAKSNFRLRLESTFARVVARLHLRHSENADPALAGFVRVALLRNISLSAPSEKDGIFTEARAVQSAADAMLYLRRVRKATRLAKMPI